VVFDNSLVGSGGARSRPRPEPLVGPAEVLTESGLRPGRTRASGAVQGDRPTRAVNQTDGRYHDKDACCPSLFLLANTAFCEPHLLLNASNVDRIQKLARSDQWAANVVHTLTEAVNNWPASHEFLRPNCAELY
jgi:hypothetical protein